MLASRTAAAVRLWAAAATALAAAAAADSLTEFLSNTGLLGGGAVRDVHHESVLPVLLLALTMLLALALAVALGARRAHRFSFVSRSRIEASCWAAGTLLATLLIVLVMEAYETRFGGVTAFDPRAVIWTHAPAAFAACAVVAAGVNRLVAVCLRAALAAGRAVADVLVRILDVGAGSGAATPGALAFETLPVRGPLMPATGAHRLRAPPRRRSTAPFLRH